MDESSKDKSDKESHSSICLIIFGSSVFVLSLGLILDLVTRRVSSSTISELDCLSTTMEFMIAHDSMNWSSTVDLL